MRTLIENGRLVFPDRVEEGLRLLIEGGRISRIGNGDYDCDERIDAGGCFVAPGFMDIHVHGGNGYDFMDGDKESFVQASLFHMTHGTTTIVPTTLSSTDEELLRSFEGFREAKAQLSSGPELLGMHLEGPYFAYSQRGAQDPKFIRNPERESYEKILDAGKDIIVRWSAACELDGALELGRTLRSRGILAAIGHSDAMFEDIKKAINNGYSHVTHLYSGMSSLRRVNAFRVLGLVECSYLFDELTVEIIADGRHLPPELLRMIVKCKNNDQICLITDAMRCAGAEDGTFGYMGSRKNGQKVVIEDGVAKMPDRSCFAGSVCTTDRCVRTMFKDAGLKIETAVKMASLNPARVMGVSDRKGSLAVGKDADICVFDDDVNIKRVVCGGETTYCG